MTVTIVERMINKGFFIKTKAESYPILLIHSNEKLVTV
jgi:hypothetical protein